MDTLEEIAGWIWDRLLPLLMILLAIAIVVVPSWLIYVLWVDSKSPTFELRKDEWACSASIERQSTTYIKSGDVMVPITSHYKHCTQWSERHGPDGS